MQQPTLGHFGHGGVRPVLPGTMPEPLGRDSEKLEQEMATDGAVRYATRAPGSQQHGRPLTLLHQALRDPRGLFACGRFVVSLA